MGFFDTGGLINVGVALTLQDHFSAPASKIMQNLSSITSSTGKAIESLKLGYVNSMQQGFGLLKGMADLANYSTEVEKDVFRTSAMVRGNFEQDRKALLDRAMEINLRNPLTIKDITSGQKFMAMAGMAMDKIQAAAEPAAQLAALFDMNMGGKGGTADLMTNIMATFSISADKAAETANTLAIATTTSNMSLDDLAQSMKYSGAAAKNLGIGVQELAAYIGILGNRGIQGSMAGTNLAQSLNQLIKNISSGGDALKAIGIDPASLKDAQGNLKPIHEVFTIIAGKISQMNTIDRQSTMLKLFNLRGMRAANIILDDIINGSAEYNRMMYEMSSKQGWLDETTKEFMKGPGWIDVLVSAFDNLRTVLGGVIKDFFQPVSEYIIVPTLTMLAKLGETFTGKFIIGATIVGTVFKIIRSGFGYLSTSLKLITANLTAGAMRTKAVSTGLNQSTLMAQTLNNALMQVEATLKRIAFYSYRAAGGRGAMSLGGGLFYGIDKHGNATYRDSRGRFVPAPTFIPPIVPGTGSTGAGATSAAQGLNTRFLKFRALGLNPSTTRSIASGVAGISRGIGSIAGFMMGPWGLAASILITTVPAIYNFISKKVSEREKERQALKKAAQNQEMINILRGIYKQREEMALKLSIDGKEFGTYKSGEAIKLPSTMFDDNGSDIF